jgi:hypothetical protein
MAYNGASVGGIVFSPLWVAAIALREFPVAAPAIGVVTAVTVWLLADLTLSKTPRQMGLLPDGDAIAASAVPRSRRHRQSRCRVRSSGAIPGSSRSLPAWRSACSRRSD